MVAIARQSGIPQNRIVMAQLGSTPPGFGLSIVPAGVIYRAHYPDGLIEEIKPVGGTPRPDPDTAVRTKQIIVPTNMRTQFGGFSFSTPSSKYSGLMRQVVQMEYLRGKNSKFGFKYQKTHGIVEYPRPRVVGLNKADENRQQRLRRFWLIEISIDGVFAAPIKVTSQKSTCGKFLDPALNTIAESAGAIDLHTWFSNGDYNTTITRLLDGTTMGVVYAAGPAIGYLDLAKKSEIGWAFSYSGHRAMAVVGKRAVNPSTGVEFGPILVKVFDIHFTVLPDTKEVISMTRVGQVVTVVIPNHGLPVGAVALIKGAEQAVYNGQHTLFSSQTDAFTFVLPVGVEPDSPATGFIIVENMAGPAAIFAELVDFPQTNTTLVSEVRLSNTSPGVTYQNVKIFGRKDSSARVNMLTGITDSFFVDGVFTPPKVFDVPVHVYFDGDTPIITRFYSENETEFFPLGFPENTVGDFIGPVTSGFYNSLIDLRCNYIYRGVTAGSANPGPNLEGTIYSELYFCCDREMVFMRVLTKLEEIPVDPITGPGGTHIPSIPDSMLKASGVKWQLEEDVEVIVDPGGGGGTEGFNVIYTNPIFGVANFQLTYPFDYLRGAMYYIDFNGSPSDQADNKWYKLQDENAIFEGGFSDLPTDGIFQGFIGLV